MDEMCDESHWEICSSPESFQHRIIMSILYVNMIYVFMLFISYYFTSLGVTIDYSAQQLRLVFASDSSDPLFLSLRRWVQYIEQTEMKPKRNRTFIRSIWMLSIRRYVQHFLCLEPANHEKLGAW